MRSLKRQYGRFITELLNFLRPTTKWSGGIVIGLIFSAGDTFANPEGGQTISGNVIISSPAANTVHIQQTTDKAIIHWNSFNINANEKTHFQQPNANSMTLNRINPTQGVSKIYGQLTANGKIILVNQSGIFFGPGSYVNVGGIIASTSNLSNDNFLSGKYLFDEPSTYFGSIINKGTIKSGDSGLVALLGTSVQNDGLIVANTGTAILASGSKFTLDFSGDQLINFTTNGASIKKGVDQDGNLMDIGTSNTGKIVAHGGTVIMSARSINNVLDHAINMSGVIVANSIKQKNGVIILSAGHGKVNVSGKISATGKKSSQTGGSITITGNHIHLENKAIIDASGYNGGGTILIGGDYQGKNPAILNAETTFIGKGVTISADALNIGNGGKVIVWGTKDTQFYGSISAIGGATQGDGGFVETSGAYLDIYGGRVNLLSSNGKIGTWLLDPTDVNIDNNPTTGIGFNNLTNTYTPNIIGSGASTLNAGDLGTQLQTANILVVTTNPSGTGNGDIILNDIANQLQTNWGAINTTLTLQADRHITIQSNLSLAGSNQGLTLKAGQTVSTGTVTINGTIDGNVNLTATSGATGNVTIAGALGANIALNSLSITGATNLNANVTTSGSQLFNSATTLSGSRTLTGNSITLGAVALGANILTINNTSASTISGIISGTNGGLTKSGTGVLTLSSAANTYTGQTTINNGTLSVGTLAAGGTASSLGSTAAATPILIGSSTGGILSYTGGTVSTNRLISINGSGGGTIQNTNSLATLTLTGTLSGNGNPITFDVAGNITKSTGVISGAGTTVTKNGNGILQFSIANTYTGSTLINAGTLRLALASGIPSASSVILADVNGANLNLNNFSNTIASLSGGGSNGGNIILGTGTLTSGGNNTSTTYNGIISGTGGMTKTGTGTLTLGAANTYSGPTTVSAGTLKQSAANAIGINSAVNLSVTGAVLDLNSFNSTLGSLTGVTGTSVLLGSGTLTTGGNNTATTYTGIISGTGSLIKTGTNVMTLANANTYTGATSINNGTLTLTNLNALGSGSNQSSSTTVASGASLILNFTTQTLGNTNDIILNGDGVGNAGALVGTATTDTLSNNIYLGSNTTIGGAGTLVLNGTLNGGYNLTKVGAGTIRLGGNNTYSGTTTVNAGTLSINHIGALGNSSATTIASGSVLSMNLVGGVLANTGNITINGTGITSSGVITGTGAGNTLNNNIILNSASSLGGTGTMVFNGVISGGFDLTKVGAGSIDLAGNNTYSGNTVISAGTLNITQIGGLGNSSAISVTSGAALNMNLAGGTLTNTSPITLNGTGITATGSLTGTGTGSTLNNAIILGSASSIGGTGSITLKGVVSGAFNLTKVGTGSLTLGANNTYGGATTVSAGTLSISNPGGLGNSTSTSITSGATLDMSFSYDTLANTNAITLNGVGVSSLGALTVTGTDVVLSNSITLASASRIGGSGVMAINGNIGGAFALTKVGASTLIFNGINTYTGSTTINAGILSINADSGLGTAPGVATAGSITFGGGLLKTTDTFTLNSNRGIALTGAGTLSTDANTVLTYNGITAGSSTFTKAGTGSLIVGGSANTYTGATNINAGLLTINKATGLGTVAGGVTIASGATLKINNVAVGAEAMTVNGSGFDGNGAVTTLGTVSYGGNITLASNSKVAELSGGTLTLSGIISGSNDLALSAVPTTGTIILSGANTYTGSTTMSSGTLTLNNANALGSLSNQSNSTTISPGATLNMNFSTASLGNTKPITLGGSGINSNGALIGTTSTDTLLNPIILTSDTTIGGAGALILNGSISGAFNVIKAGAGSLTLGENNTYGGTMTINAGTLTISHIGGLGNATSTYLASGAVLNMNLSSGLLTNTNDITINGTGIASAGALIGSGILNNAIILGSNSSVGGTGVMTLNGAISGGFNMTKVGTGTVTFGGNNSYSGVTTVSAGTLSIANKSGLGNSTATSVTSGATLDMNFSSDTLINANAITLNGAGVGSLGALTGTGTNMILSNLITLGSAVTIGGSGSMTLNGVISGAFSVTKTGLGTIELNALNSYTGFTRINQGILSGNTILNGGVNSSLGASANAAANLVLAGGTLKYTGSTSSSNRNYTLIAATTNTIDISSPGTNLTISGASTATTGALTKAGEGTLTLSGVNLYTGLTTVNGGILAAGINNALASNALTVSGGTYHIATFLDSINSVTLLSGSITGTSGTLTSTAYQVESGSITANLAGTGTLVKNTSGTVTLSGNNTFSGATTINAGTLSLLTANSLGNTASTTISSGALLNLGFNNAILTNANAITINGTGISNSGAIALSGNTISLNNPITLASNSLISGNGAGLMTLGGTISGAANVSITLNNAGLSLPVISLSSGGNLAVTTNGPITQTGILTIPGTTTMSAASNTILLNSNNMLSGSVSLSNTGLNDITLRNNMNLLLGSSIAGRQFTATAAGTITLGGSITANATGDSIVLSGTRFDNSGLFSLNPGNNGRFLVWSSNSNPFGGATPDVPGNLIYQFKQYNAIYGVSSVQGTGDGLLYTLAPVLTPTLTGIISKAYNGNAIADVTGHYAVSGTVDGDTVTLSPNTGTYLTPNVGTAIPVSVSGITIASATNGSAIVYGYSLSTTTTSANIGVITPASLSIASNSGQTKVYGNNDPISSETAYSITSGILYGSDSLTGNMGRISGENVGNYDFTQNTVSVNDGNSGNNYAIIFDGSTNPFEITARPLSGMISNQSKTYGENDPALNTIPVTLGNVVNTNVTDINGNVTYINDTNDVATTLSSLVRNSGEDVGDYAITSATFNALTGSASSNYLMPIFTGTPALTINKANLSGMISNQEKVYGTNDPNLSGISVTLNGVIDQVVSTWNGNVAINDTGNVEATLSALVRNTGENVGDYTITSGTFNSLTGSAALNYDIPTFTGSPILTINPTNVIVNANPETKVYGTPNPILTYSDSGLVNANVVDWMNNITSINDQLTGSLTRDPGENVGNYAITLGTLSAGSNYNMNYTGANFSITPATLTTLGILANNKNYDGNAIATLNFNSAVLNGIVFGDDVSLDTADYAAYFLNANVGNHIPVTVTYLTLTGSSAQNYIVIPPTNLTADILSSVTPVKTDILPAFMYLYSNDHFEDVLNNQWNHLKNDGSYFTTDEIIALTNKGCVLFDENIAVCGE